MQLTIKNLKITIDETGPEPEPYNARSPKCDKGYAVYRYVGSRKMQRVGGATCVFPNSGQTAGSSPSSVMISTALQSTLATLLTGRGQIAELRFALCCPPPASISFTEETAKPQPAPGRSRRKAR